MYKKIHITNRHLYKDDFYETIASITKGDIDMLILREKDLSESEYEAMAEKVLTICRKNGVKCILHTFVNTAKKLKHPHIHLSMEGFRALTEEEKVFFETIGVSTHTVDEAVFCEKNGASYITASHIFETKCKEGVPPKGLDLLKDCAQAVSIPVYALGGIDPSNAGLCIKAGAAGVCTMSGDASFVSRYDRQTLLPQMGSESQIKLKNSSVLVIGAGGLGCPALMYLTGAGIGTIGIVDADTVSVTNIHRQILHSEANIGMNKALSAAGYLRKLNSGINIEIYTYMLNADNAEELISGYDFIIDATDDFKIKLLINDVCAKNKKPFSYAGVIGFTGQTLTFVPDEGPCLRCLFEDIPDNEDIPRCNTEGVFGPVCGIIGCIQASEALKYLTRAGDLLTGHLFTVDALTMKTRRIPFLKAAGTCPVCGYK